MEQKVLNSWSHGIKYAFTAKCICPKYFCRFPLQILYLSTSKSRIIYLRCKMKKLSLVYQEIEENKVSFGLKQEQSVNGVWKRAFPLNLIWSWFFWIHWQICSGFNQTRFVLIFCSKTKLIWVNISRLMNFRHLLWKTRQKYWRTLLACIFHPLSWS